MLSIADAERLANAKAKFEGSTEKLEGFPLMTVGKNQSTVLVKDRFQVKVSSQRSITKLAKPSSRCSI